MESPGDSIIWMYSQDSENATLSNSTIPSNSSTIYPSNVTELIGNTTSSVLNSTTQLLEGTTSTVKPTDPPTHTRYCEENRIGCTEHGVCMELNLGGTVTQKCECFCGYFGRRCTFMDVPKYYQECMKYGSLKAGDNPSRQISRGLDPVHVFLGVACSLLLLLLLFWFIYWRMCKYRYRIGQLKHQLSLYQADEGCTIETRLAPGTYWHNLAFQPDESPLQHIDTDSVQQTQITQTVSSGTWGCYPTELEPSGS